MSLSDKALRAIKPTGAVHEVADGQGLSVRVSAKGRIVFQYRYRYRGVAQRMDLGTYPLMSLAEARDAHSRFRKLLDQNIDPDKARADAAHAENTAGTVEQLAEDFIQRKLRRDRKLPEEAERALRANVIPHLGQLKVKDVTRRDVVAVIEKIVDRGAPIMANRTTSLVKQMFQFAVVKGVIESNPCVELTRTSIGGPEKPRDTYLSYQQIWRLWHGLEKAGFSETLKLCVKILLATGQRRQEIMLGRWSHLDSTRRLWIIPADLSKNGKAHVVHLVPLVWNLFLELKTYTSDSDYFVPSSVGDEDQPMGIYAINTAIQRWRHSLGIPGVSPHVLRHTFSTQVSGIGVAPHIVEKLLNHSLTGMLAVYNHQNYYPEREAALRKWAERLEEIIAAPTEEQVPREPSYLDDANLTRTSEDQLKHQRII